MAAVCMGAGDSKTIGAALDMITKDTSTIINRVVCIKAAQQSFKADAAPTAATMATEPHTIEVAPIVRVAGVKHHIGLAAGSTQHTKKVCGGGE